MIEVLKYVIYQHLGSRVAKGQDAAPRIIRFQVLSNSHEKLPKQIFLCFVSRACPCLPAEFSQVGLVHIFAIVVVVFHFLPSYIQYPITTGNEERWRPDCQRCPTSML